MAKIKKSSIDNAEIKNFIANVSTRFEGQRNTLNFMKKIGNTDSSAVIASAAEMEVNFVIDRINALQRIAQEQAPLSAQTSNAIDLFIKELCETAKSDITINGFDSSELMQRLNDEIPSTQPHI